MAGVPFNQIDSKPRGSPEDELRRALPLPHVPQDVNPVDLPSLPAENNALPHVPMERNAADLPSLTPEDPNAFGKNVVRFEDKRKDWEERLFKAINTNYSKLPPALQVPLGMGAAAPSALWYNAPTWKQAFPLLEMVNQGASAGIAASQAKDGEGMDAALKQAEKSWSMEKFNRKVVPGLNVPERFQKLYDVWDAPLTDAQKERFTYGESDPKTQQHAYWQSVADDKGWVDKQLAKPGNTYTAAELKEMQDKTVELVDINALREANKSFNINFGAGVMMGGKRGGNRYVQAIRSIREAALATTASALAHYRDNPEKTAKEAGDDAQLVSVIARLTSAGPAAVAGMAKWVMKKWNNHLIKVGKQTDNFPDNIKAIFNGEPVDTGPMPGPLATLLGEQPDAATRLRTITTEGSEAQRRELGAAQRKVAEGGTQAAANRVADAEGFSPPPVSSRVVPEKRISSMKETLEKTKKNWEMKIRDENGIPALDKTRLNYKDKPGVTKVPYKELEDIVKGVIGRGADISAESRNKLWASIRPFLDNQFDVSAADKLAHKADIDISKLKKYNEWAESLWENKPDAKVLDDMRAAAKSKLGAGANPKAVEEMAQREYSNFLSIGQKGDPKQLLVANQTKNDKLAELAGEAAIKFGNPKGKIAAMNILDAIRDIKKTNYEPSVRTQAKKLVEALEGYASGVLGKDYDKYKKFKTEWGKVRGKFDEKLGPLNDKNSSPADVLAYFNPAHSDSVVNVDNANKALTRFGDLSAALAGKSGDIDAGSKKAAGFLLDMMNDENDVVRLYDTLLNASIGKGKFSAALDVVGNRAVKSFFVMSKDTATAGGMDRFLNLSPSQVQKMRQRAIGRLTAKGAPAEDAGKTVDKFFQNAVHHAYFRGAVSLQKRFPDSPERYTPAFAAAYRKMLGGENSKQARVFDSLFPATDLDKYSTPREKFNVIATMLEATTKGLGAEVYAPLSKAASKVFTFGEVPQAFYRIFVRPALVAVSHLFGVQEVAGGILKKQLTQARVTSLLNQLGADLASNKKDTQEAFDKIFGPNNGVVNTGYGMLKKAYIAKPQYEKEEKEELEKQQ